MGLKAIIAGRGSLRTRMAAIIGALMLAGCASTYTPPPVAQVEPATLTGREVKAIVLASRTTGWKDPKSITGARIGDPLQCRVYGSTATTNLAGSTCVCIELNAKNSYGGYVGLKREVFNVTAGSIDQVNYGTAGPPVDLCPNLQPFPELNGDYSAPSSARSHRSPGAKI